jgi:hypothetical protein
MTAGTKQDPWVLTTPSQDLSEQMEMAHDAHQDDPL